MMSVSRRTRSPIPPDSPLPCLPLEDTEETHDDDMHESVTPSVISSKKKGARTSSAIDEDEEVKSSESGDVKRRKKAVNSNSSSVADVSMQHRAASKIQALIRGAKTRVAVRKGVLLKAWTELDWREEQELLSSHSAYEALKRAVTHRIQKDERPSSSSTKKKTAHGRKIEQSAEEEEAACGLLLRDKDRLTFEFVTAMLEHFRQNKRLPASLIHKLIARVTPILKAEPNIVPVSCTARLIVVGDLHGQLDDLLAIFKLTGMPSSRTRYLFNGDFVDRGQHSVECITTLLALHTLYPHDVLLNRGNHESRDLNGRDGFENECLEKYPKDLNVFNAFSAVFSLLPLGHLIDQQVLVIHGGLCPTCPTLDEIQALNRFHEVPPSNSIMEYLMWSDPQSKKGRAESPRGAGILFGADVTNEFLKKNGLNLIVRSHECMEKGFQYHHHEKCITVFSASNYCGTVGNDGALVVFERDSSPIPTHTSSSSSSSSSSSTSSSHSHQKDSAAASSSSSHDDSAHATTSASHSHPTTPRSPRLAAAAAASSSAPSRDLHHASKSLTSPSSSAGRQVKLKRSIVTFYAAKKEKQSVFRATGNSNLESDIISKLLHIISDHRLHLVAYYDKIAQTHSASVRTVTRTQWATGLKTVLSLPTLPFSEFQELLGLPKLGVDGKTKGVIDYMSFLARFRPVNLVVLRAQRRAREAANATTSQQTWGASFDSMTDTQSIDPCSSFDQASYDPAASPSSCSSSPPVVLEDESDEMLQSILEFLNRNRFELESLFHYLDQDNSLTITRDEFVDGIISLQKHLPTKFTKQQIHQSGHHSFTIIIFFFNHFSLLTLYCTLFLFLYVRVCGVY